jgi:acetylglutamate kinase
MAVKTLLIKLGGDTVYGPRMAGLCRDIQKLHSDGHRVVITHGGGPQATALSERLGIQPNIVAGRRVTDDATLEVMKYTLAGQVNVDLCCKLRAAGLKPVGLHDVVVATKRPPKVVLGAGPEPVDFGRVGDVIGFEMDALWRLSDAGYLPVVACLGHGVGAEAGLVFNINADVVANQMAGAIRADALLLVTNTPGVLRDVRDPSTRIGQLTVGEGKRAIEDGTVSRGMIPKLEESFAALEKGARAIYIVDGELDRAVREPGSVGTVLTA